VLNAELNFTSAKEPVSFIEPEKEPTWQAAMRKKMKVIEENDTWELTSLPANHHAISPKWVYKVKRNEVGNVV
jgi:hypothetical protein